jgi:DNA-binding transcriptional ArsR family regulator
MTTIDLIHSIPDDLAETATLKDLLETVRVIDSWEERQAEVLDFIYRLRVVRLIRSKADSDALIEMIRHLDKVTHPRRVSQLNGLKKAYGDRWMAYMDILDTRLAALQSGVPARLLARRNVREILELVLARGEIRRSEIGEAFNLKPANLTRILNMMAAAELIECRVKGREKRVLPGANAGIACPVKPPSHSRRGMSYLNFPKAA